MEDNAKVRFRIGGSSLPKDITSGYISVNEKQGYLFVDSGDNRVRITGDVFCQSDTPASEDIKLIYAQGFAEIDGSTITLVLEYVDKNSNRQIYVQVIDPDTEITTTAIPLMSNDTTGITGIDLDSWVPYSFVYMGGRFVLTSGNLNPKLKWKRIPTV